MNDPVSKKKIRWRAIDKKYPTPQAHVCTWDMHTVCTHICFLKCVWLPQLHYDCELRTVSIFPWPVWCSPLGWPAGQPLLPSALSPAFPSALCPLIAPLDQAAVTAVASLLPSQPCRTQLSSCPGRNGSSHYLADM